MSAFRNFSRRSLRDGATPITEAERLESCCLATVMGLLGIAGAYLRYVSDPSTARPLGRQWRTAYELSFHKWYVDEVYDRSHRPSDVQVADRMCAKRIDVGVIDGAVNGVARAIAWGGWFLRLVQSGQTQHYALGHGPGRGRDSDAYC